MTIIDRVIITQPQPPTVITHTPLQGPPGPPGTANIGGLDVASILNQSQLLLAVQFGAL